MWRKVIFLIPMMIVFYNRFLIWFHSGQIASIWKEIPSYCTVKVVTFAQKKYIEDLNVNNRYNVMHNGNWTEWSAIWAEILCVIWNHKYDFRPKLHDTRFNYHFITSILKSPKYRTWSVQIFYWCSTELVWN